LCLLQASSGNFNASNVLEKLEDITKGNDSQTGDLLIVSSILEHVVNGINISMSTNVTQVTHVCISYELLSICYNARILFYCIYELICHDKIKYIIILNIILHKKGSPNKFIQCLPMLWNAQKMLYVCRHSWTWLVTYWRRKMRCHGNRLLKKWVYVLYFDKNNILFKNIVNKWF